jgi:tRNA modification GTPase
LTNPPAKHIMCAVMEINTDTIVAITTATGNAGIAIVRVSGPDSISIAKKIFHRPDDKSSESDPNSFKYGYIRNTENLTDLDEVLLLTFKAPHSYTREDVIEIQGHGGRACAQRILRTVLNAGARMAEPGEFTKRAFLNGRIDLLQAEAVLDLIQASSERAASAAMEQLEGSLSNLFADIYDNLMSVAANLEATLDFSDQELPDNILPDIENAIEPICTRLQDALNTWEEGHILREGASIVITGDTNVGKSTLLNKLLESDRAIVTDIPGTTRDVIEEQIIINGITFRLFDTAGIRDSDCDIERQGISRAQELLKSADIILYIIDSTIESSSQDLERLSALKSKSPIVALNKQDLNPGFTGDFAEFQTIPCSLLDNTGLDDIRSALADKTSEICAGPPHAVISERHRHIIQYVLNIIAEAKNTLDPKDESSIVPSSSLLRDALETLGTITGQNYTDQLLENIFDRFCIGK